MGMSMDFLYTHDFYVTLPLLVLASEQAQKEIASSPPLQPAFSS
jgi:hypothetical protein